MLNVPAETPGKDASALLGTRVVVFAATAVTLLLFAPLLPVDLRLDELGSYWVVKDDLRAVFERSLEIQGQSPLYYVVLWSAVQILGVAPWALRVPSLVFTWLSSLIVFRLGALLVGRSVGFLSVFGFLLCSQLECVAIEARPYALAILCASVSSLLFLHWLRSPRIMLGVVYSLSAAATVYAHYLFASVLFIHFLWFCLQLAKAENDRRRDLLRGGAAIAIILLVWLFPAWRQLSWLSSKGNVLSFAHPPTVPSIVRALVPLDVVLVLAVTAIFRLTVWRDRILGLHSPSMKSVVAIVIILMVVPPLFLLAGTFLSGHPLLVGRYFSAQCLGVGIASGLVISLSHNLARQMVIVTVILSIRLLMQYTLVTKENSGEGWGEALQFLRIYDPTHQCLLLNVSGFVESRMLGRDSTGMAEEFMRAPLMYHGIPNESALIPYSLDGQDAQRYFQSMVLPRLAGAPCAWLLYWNVALDVDGSFGELSVLRLERDMPELGFVPADAHRMGLVDVIRYARKGFLGSSAMRNVIQDLGSFPKDIAE